MPKHPNIVALIDELASDINPNTLGLESSKSHAVCVFGCGEATTFRDALSEKEYRISGMCQQCQDKTFGV